MKSIQINAIFTYDNKDQDMIDLFMSESEFAYHLRNEVAFLKWVLERSFPDHPNTCDALDLLKITKAGLKPVKTNVPSLDPLPVYDPNLLYPATSLKA